MGEQARQKLASGPGSGGGGGVGGFRSCEVRDGVHKGGSHGLLLPVWKFKRKNDSYSDEKEREVSWRMMPYIQKSNKSK